jgi:DNA-binding response OmpR family regulator
LVLLDLKLPRMDGVAFVRWLGGQENLRGMRIAVISASAGRFRSDLDVFREHVVSVTQKPFDLDIVLKQVEEHCGRPSP